MYGGLMSAHNVAEALSPGHWVTNYRWTSFFLLIQLLRFPGVVILWFAVLAVRVPSLREVVRSAYRRLLIPGRLLVGGMAAVPVLALTWLVASRSERAGGRCGSRIRWRSRFLRPLGSCCWRSSSASES